MTLLVVAEHDNTELKSATHHTLAAAQQIGEDIELIILGQNCDSVIQSAAQLGASKVRHVQAPHYQDQGVENLALCLAQLAGSYSHVILPATSFGKDLGPRLAALLDVAQVSEVIRINSPDTFVRPIYAGSVLETVQSTDPVKVLTVRTSAFDPVQRTDTASPIEAAPAGPDLGVTRLLSRELNHSARPDLTSASVVISGGRSLGSEENFRALLDPLADKLHAAIGATRAASDAGYAPNDHQVGQTGKTVAPELYIAIGISGSIQHTAGMKDSKVIVAINKDPEAPIFQIADYGIVGDLFEVVPALTEALE